MKKYIIEVSEDCMEQLQTLKREKELKSISKVVEFVTEMHFALVTTVGEKEKELNQYRQKLVEIALKS
jgi:hypothetical protein